jgi:hypothetical protein
MVMTINPVLIVEIRTLKNTAARAIHIPIVPIKVSVVGSISNKNNPTNPYIINVHPSLTTPEN